LGLQLTGFAAVAADGLVTAACAPLNAARHHVELAALHAAVTASCTRAFELLAIGDARVLHAADQVMRVFLGLCDAFGPLGWSGLHGDVFTFFLDV
jgi:predicted regulator of Ras-like GTPase activity (Roadblock/LC7/MglB family)